MPPDPNARLLKAIEDLTRSVNENTKQLKEYIRLEKKKHIQVTTHNYLEGENAEPTAGEGNRNPYDPYA